MLFDPALLQWLGFVVLFLLVAPLFPFIYVVLRWRTGAQPCAGTYAGLLYFTVASILLALAGAANLTYGWLSSTPLDEELNRISWGMFVGSIAFLGLNAFLVTRRPKLPEARRVFGGFFMIMTGLVTFTVLILFCISLFRTVNHSGEALDRSENLKLYGAWTAYYLAAYLLTVRSQGKNAGD